MTASLTHVPHNFSFMLYSLGNVYQFCCDWSVDGLLTVRVFVELATQLGTDTLTRILRGVRAQPTVAPLSNCVNRDFPIDLEFASGTISYRLVGPEVHANIQVRFRLPTTTAAETTPGTTTEPVPRCPTLPTTTPLFETTTPLQTTTAAETTPGTTTEPVPRCPTLPTTPAPTTTTESETTTTA
ncbi:hypothetical protein BaRGS_00033435 [Batillaria attramentaria]|uniref:Uncharacterized protein n=1 Tax=Batillaria attramentaria TaxID=370345 RepID=A0ABD0JKN6_9CAEN